MDRAAITADSRVGAQGLTNCFFPEQLDHYGRRKSTVTGDLRIDRSADEESYNYVGVVFGELVVE